MAVLQDVQKPDPRRDCCARLDLVKLIPGHGSDLFVCEILIWSEYFYTEKSALIQAALKGLFIHQTGLNPG